MTNSLSKYIYFYSSKLGGFIYMQGYLHIKIRLIAQVLSVLIMEFENVPLIDDCVVH